MASILVPTEGLNHYQDVVLHGATQVPRNSWLIGLMGGTGVIQPITLADSDTYASHPGWNWIEDGFSNPQFAAWGPDAAVNGATKNSVDVGIAILSFSGWIGGTFGFTLSGGAKLLWMSKFVGGSVYVTGSDIIHITHTMTVSSG